MVTTRNGGGLVCTVPRRGGKDGVAKIYRSGM